MRRLEVLNQLREDLVEILDELTGITRNKRKLSRTSIARVAALNAEASAIRAMIRHLQRKDP
jgi:protoheme ferro-lyase